MYQLEMIDKIARLRRKEIDWEVFKSYKIQKSVLRNVSYKLAHLDLTVRLVLRPRLSLSIWLGRGA